MFPTGLFRPASRPLPKLNSARASQCSQFSQRPFTCQCSQGESWKRCLRRDPLPQLGRGRAEKSHRPEGVSWLERGGCRVWRGGEGEGLVGRGHVDTAAESRRDWGQQPLRIRGPRTSHRVPAPGARGQRIPPLHSASASSPFPFLWT